MVSPSMWIATRTFKRCVFGRSVGTTSSNASVMSTVTWNAPARFFYARYLRYALAFTSELEYHAIAGRDIGVIKVDDFISLSAQAKTVRMMLFGLLKRLDK